jgi:hypothetical protein
MTPAQLAADAKTVLERCNLFFKRVEAIRGASQATYPPDITFHESAHRNAEFLKLFAVERPVAVNRPSKTGIRGWTIDHGEVTEVISTKNQWTPEFVWAGSGGRYRGDWPVWHTEQAARTALFCDKRDALLREMETVFGKGE